LSDLLAGRIKLHQLRANRQIGADFDDMPALLRRRRLIPGEA
jgi:hypothetical protein